MRGQNAMDLELMNQRNGRNAPRGNGPHVRFGRSAVPFDGPTSEIDEEEERPTRPMVPNASPEAVAEYLSQYKMPVRTPLHIKVNFVPVLLLIFYLCAAAFYFYVRITKTLVTGPVFAYGIVVLVVEFLGLSATLPYAILLTISLVPKGSATGLPAEEEGLNSTERFNFHARVLIPCYKEDMSVIKPTVMGALNADLPMGAKRTVYLCDDGNEEAKKVFIEQLAAEGRDVEYVSGRKKIPKDTNGKSSNLNNCLMNVIYKEYRYPGTKEISWEKIPETEIIVVFDADMVAKKHFFLRILEPLTNPKYALCLSPQAFHNIHPGADLFNNINLQFWEYWLPGAVAWGYIACTGTNFAIRARPLAHCKFFPTYTITEDYALGMELKKHGYKGSYLLDYIAEGEAPDEVRNVMRQRSRWCKGHMQVFFSWKYSPLTQWRLSIFQKLWYSYGTWSYIVNVIATPVSLLIPFLSLGFGLNPVIINYWFAAGATAYYLAIFLVQTYFHQLAHIKSLWFANISNTVLWFTYTKAVINVLLSKFGLKGGVGFKVTEKKVAETALALPLAAVQRGFNRVLSRVSSRRRDAPPPRPFEGVTYDSVEKADAPTPGATPTSVHEFPPGGATPSNARAPPPPYSPLQSQESSGVSVVGTPGGPVNLTVVVNNPRETEPLLSESRPLPKKRAPWYKRFASIFVAKNLVDVGGVLDPTVLYIMLGFCLAVVGMAIWRTATTPAGGRGARYVSLSPYVGLPLFWALYNSIAPFLFVVYSFTSGKPFRKAAAWGQFLGTLTLLGAVILLWATVPVDFNMKEATFKAGSYLSQLRTNAASFQDIAAISNGTASQKDVTGGWLIGSDPVKYGMPLATSASLLAWSMLEFPQGYKDAEVFDQSLQNVVAAGTYILNNWDATNSVFIAQVGDPTDYLTEGDAPSLGSIWTRLKNDPNLGAARQAYILDSTHVGVDLLAESAAALALSSVLVRNSGNTQQADSFLQGAEALYTLAKSTPGQEQSYCAFVPCGTTVSKAKMVPVVPLPASANLDPADIKCWVPDFPLATCGFLKDEELCLNAAQTAPVYTRRSSCCAFMRSAGVWQNQTTPQGACALPEGQFECFVPQLQTRDCLTQNISLDTGKGCTGLGQDFFPTPESCCNQLTKSQAITAAAPGRGVCALGPSTCFVPNTVSRSCIQLNSTSGSQCAAFGATDQFDSALTCCNSLVANGAINSDNPGRGLCADTALSTCWVADLAGKRCIALPSALPGFEDAKCADFNSKTRFDDKATCCNGLYVQVGGVGPFFDPSCAPPPTPAPSTPVPTVRAVVTAAPVLPAATLPARRLLEDDVSPSNRRLLQTVDVSPFLNLPQNVLAQQEQKLVQTTVPVDFYPSHTVLDDLSWAGVALFLATGQERYLGDAQFYMTQHLAREAVGAQLNTEAGYYVYNYDTAVWAAAIVLARVTDLPQYHEQIRTFLRAWVELTPPKISPDVLAAKQLASQAVKNQNMIKENIQTFNNQSFLVFDGCTPDRNNTKEAKLVAAQLALKNAALGATGPVILTDPFAVTFEENCNDGRDNDCDGLTDMEDPDCPFMPVQSSDLSLAWTKDAPLPNAAAASFLALIYSTTNKTNTEQKRGLKCWALGQMRYMMGDNFLYPDSWSYVVGFGNKGYRRPTRIPDRESSCPADANQPCDFFNGYFPGLPNPQLGLVTGALVAGPNLDDSFTDSRTSNNTRVGADFQTAFLAAMSGLLDMGVDVKTCGQLQGVYNDVFGSRNL